MIYILLVLIAIAVFYLGVILGIKDCKKHYGIPKGISPDKFVFGEVKDDGDGNA